MKSKIRPGLGELLRYVGELVEQGAEAQYGQMRLNYRARYTPVLRALQAGATTVTDITGRTHLTQGAISQTVALLETDGLITRRTLEDNRKSGIQLTPAGRRLVAQLDQHWDLTFAAIEQLEKDIGYPLREALQAAAQALERQDFSAQINAISQSQA